MRDSLGCVEPISKNIKTWEDAKAEFAIKNSKYRALKLTNPNFEPKTCLPHEPFVEPSKLDHYSQLNHCIKQQCFTKHIYSPRGYDIRHPYLNPKWVTYILNIPVHYCYRQLLFRKIQQSTWPNLFNK